MHYTVLALFLFTNATASNAEAPVVQNYSIACQEEKETADPYIADGFCENSIVTITYQRQPGPMWTSNEQLIQKVAELASDPTFPVAEIIPGLDLLPTNFPRRQGGHAETELFALENWNGFCQYGYSSPPDWSNHPKYPTYTGQRDEFTKMYRCHVASWRAERASYNWTTPLYIMDIEFREKALEDEKLQRLLLQLYLR